MRTVIKYASKDILRELRELPVRICEMWGFCVWNEQESSTPAYLLEYITGEDFGPVLDESVSPESVGITEQVVDDLRELLASEGFVEYVFWNYPTKYKMLQEFPEFLASETVSAHPDNPFNHCDETRVKWQTYRKNNVPMNDIVA